VNSGLLVSGYQLFGKYYGNNEEWINKCRNRHMIYSNN